MPSFKCFYGEEIRRITLDEDLSFNELVNAVGELFQSSIDESKRKELRLQWRDDEDELITLTTQVELDEALKLTGDGIVRIFLSTEGEVDSFPVGTAESTGKKKCEGRDCWEGASFHMPPPFFFGVPSSFHVGPPPHAAFEPHHMFENPDDCSDDSSSSDDDNQDDGFVGRPFRGGLWYQRGHPFGRKTELAEDDTIMVLTMVLIMALMVLTMVLTMATMVLTMVLIVALIMALMVLTMVLILVVVALGADLMYWHTPLVAGAW
eukprot:CAMPEP_0174257846 /NCGR_PEP_ID=MMETSP0439-20130205/6947_1 /TAXON_ID=0 /ORGANISM="Stereomyxa ramosa, Strain Chinc5" /LENGTH=263 /DNA_ID=CAMNT_0015341125 /DNA_START=80 /DNA_END=869 /DNA_ORIENTATION=+